MEYQIRDENNELMRVVRRKEEAELLLKLRPQWSAKRVLVKQAPKPKFEDAPF